MGQSVQNLGVDFQAGNYLLEIAHSLLTMSDGYTNNMVLGRGMFGQCKFKKFRSMLEAVQ